MIKLIASDVDGTLVSDGDSNLDNRLFDIIRELKSMGIIFVACSGRSYTSLVNAFSPVKDDIIFCCENGGLIKCRDYVISEHHLKKEYVIELINESRNIEDIIPCLCTADKLYLERATEDDIKNLLEGYNFYYEKVDDLLKCPLDKVIKVATLDKRKVATNCGIKYNSKWREMLSVTEAGYEWLDIMSAGVSKGRAIDAIRHYLDIRKEETMSFGDNHNDIAMLKATHYSFAVANARREVKAVAKYITKSNLDGGVIKVLEKVLRGDYNFDSIN